MVTESQLCKGKTVLNKVGGCITMWVDHCRLKMIKMVPFMLYIIYHNKKCILSETRHQQNNTRGITLFV